MLRSGDQAPQEVVLNNVRNLEEMAGKASRYFETDSLTFLRYLSDPEIFRPLGYTRENFISMFIPNTYHMFWTDKPEKFVKRMKKEFDKFWTEDKIARVKKNNLNLIDAYTVASIVEKESIYDPEKPTIAGVYINRLKTGEKLQADPTVVFAVGDFSIQRILYSHLEQDSPYNTYKYAGLPPGPICMPSLSSLNAVINAENHNYMFCCAKPDNTGQHAFAVDYAGHQKNAEAFAQWLNKLNIKLALANVKKDHLRQEAVFVLNDYFYVDLIFFGSRYPVQDVLIQNSLRIFFLKLISQDVRGGY